MKPRFPRHAQIIIRLTITITFLTGTAAVNGASTIDSTGGTVITAPVDIGSEDETSIIGAGTLTLGGDGVVGLGNKDMGYLVSMNMSGGLIQIQPGVTLQNGSWGGYGDGWEGGMWAGNLASLEVAGGGTLDVWDGGPVRVDALTGDGTVTISSDLGINWAGIRVLVLGVNGGSGTFSGDLNGDYLFHGGSLAIIKEGDGTQILSGSTSYDGGTIVNRGRLVLVDNRTDYHGFTTHAELEFNVTSGSQQLYGGGIDGSGSLIKTGSGELWFGVLGASQSVALTGVNSLIDVQGGVLRNDAGNSDWASNKAGLKVSDGAVFDLWDGDTIVDELTGSGSINKGSNVDNTLTIGVNNGSGTFNGSVFNNRIDFSHGGNVGGQLSLVKLGTGTQTLTGANTYTGATSVNAGILALVGGSQQSPISVDAGASLGFTLGFPTTSTSVFDLTAGTISITGIPTMPSYTLISSSSGIVGIPRLEVPIPGYALMVEGSSLKLIQTYSGWAMNPAFDLATGDQGSNMDPDHDTMDNLVEFALNGDPSVPDPSIMPKLSVTATNFEFTYSRLDASLGETVQTFEFSSNLEDWTPVLIPATRGVSTVGAATITINDTGVTDSVKISIPRSTSTGNSLFGRLRVER